MFGQKLNTKAINDFNLDRLACTVMRLRFLREELDTLLEIGGDVEYYWASHILTEMAELTKQAYRLHETKLNKLDITPEDVARARLHPIESLIAFTKGKAIAWCHDDSNPSLTLNKKHNKAHCFVCSRSFNPIDVLRERDSYTFVEAVKSLR